MNAKVTSLRMKPRGSWIWIMAWRDTRRSRSKLILFAFSVFFGVAALVAVNSLRGNLEREVDRQSRALLGSDLEFESREPFNEEMESFFKTLDAQDEASEIRLTTMAVFDAEGSTRLVSLRAMKGGFPWYGTLDTRPAGLTVSAAQEPVALVEESLRIQFDLEIGDIIKLGEAEFRVIGELLKIPGESAFGSAFAPRILIPQAFIDDTNLLGFGSRKNFSRHFVFSDGVDPETNRQLRSQRGFFRSNNARFETAEDQKRQISNILEEMTSYLSMVGFVALLLGGVGIAGAVQVYLKEKTESVAVLRCLDARSRTSLLVFCIQIATIGFMGCVLGTLAGVGVQAALPKVVGRFLPFELPFELVGSSIAQAFLFAWGLTSLFALLPLLPLRKLSPMRAIRSSTGVYQTRKDIAVWLVVILIGGLTLTFSILQTDRLRDAFGFFGGLLGATLILTAIGLAFRGLLKRFAPKSLPFTWRQGLGNLYRPNNRTVSLMVMIGMGAFLIYTLYLCEISILKRGEINDQEDRPNTIFYDVQPDQVDRVKAIAQEMDAPLYFHDPMVTMRLTHLRAQSVSDLRRNRSEDLERWALSREYRSTFRDHLRDHETVLEGVFTKEASLDDGDPIPVSVEQRLVEALNLKRGDRLTWDVQGLPIETVVDSIREVDWRQMQPNFFVVFPTGVLEEAPANHIIAVRADDAETLAALQSAVVKRFPNISSINLSMILDSLKEIFDKVGFVVRFMASFTILTGLIALVSAVLTSRYQRIKESVLLRSLGAKTGQVRRIMAIEYFLLGGIGSASGIALSLAGAWGVTHFIFKIDLYVPWGMTFATILIIGTLTLITGMLNSVGIASRSPIEALRYE